MNSTTSQLETNELRDDLNRDTPTGGVADRAAEAAHESVDRVAGKAAEAEKKIREAAANTGETVDAKVQDAKEQIDSLSQEVRQYVEKEPLTSAGIAFAAGILVSLLLRK